MKNVKRMCCAFFVAAIVALCVPFLDLDASAKPANKKKPKKMVVARLKDRANDKPTAQEINEFGVTPKGQKARQVMAFKKGYDLLKQKGVRFDPNILLYANWREKLRDTMASEPEFQESRRGSNKLKGVQFADTLVLPEQVELTDDTVIVAKNLILEGRNVVIKGSHDIHVFSVNPIIQVEPTASLLNDTIFAPASFSASFNLNQYLKTIRIVQNGHVTVDTSGTGRKEWLEQKAQAAQASNRQNGIMTKISFSAKDRPLASLFDNRDTSGAPGADGPNGDDGFPGQIGDSPTEKAASGSCKGNKNGDDGRWGIDGGTGQAGGDGKPGVDGGDAGDITIQVSNLNENYTLRANGGDAGRGGKGGMGGIGGRGGNGGKGGDGADCPCIPTGGGGDGGDGGNAGAGGTGGKGGSGGDGGQGGDAGTITVTYPSGYDPQKIDAQAKVGAGGGVQGKGQGGYPGTPGSPGEPGKGAGPFECHGADGSIGQNGGTGSYGDQGDENGKPGEAGAKGSISIQLELNGGGGGPIGGGQYYYYYNPYQGCTDYYWVQYLSWDGGKTWEVDPMWIPMYAGCM